MAKKKKIEIKNICDDCKHREWHTQQWNLDLQGRPITFSCKAGQFANAEVRGRKACELWDKE
jgi:hypothetical protein